eukprot:13984161-Ditylum_brightwellii.AAC.1
MGLRTDYLQPYVGRWGVCLECYNTMSGFALLGMVGSLRNQAVRGVFVMCMRNCVFDRDELCSGMLDLGSCHFEGCGLLAGYWVCLLMLFFGGGLSEQGYPWCARWSGVFVAGGRMAGSSVVGDVFGLVV